MENLKAVDVLVEYRLKMLDLLETYGDDWSFFTVVAQKKLFTYSEIKPLLVKHLIYRKTSFYQVAYLLELCLLYRNEIAPECVLMIERKKTIVDEKVAQENAVRQISDRCLSQNCNAGLRH